MNTIDYYNNNCQELLYRYDNTSVKELHDIFQKYIKKDFSVLELGFGSGRDLNFIKNITQNIFGLDASIEFVKNLKNDNFFENRVTLSKLPDIDISEFEINKFDIVISIAVLMHLDKENIEKSIQNLVGILNQNAKIIISYSTENRANDDRDFYAISKKEMTNIFAKYNFKEVEYLVNSDNLNRNIKWVTQVYKFVG